MSAAARIATIALALASISPLGAAQEPIEVEGLEPLAHRPLVIMGSGGPWSSTPGEQFDGVQVGGDFFLYDDGLVIYRRIVDKTHRMMQAQLTPNDARAFVDALIDDGFLRLPTFYEACHASDQPGARILLRDHSRWYTASVSGIDRSGEITCDRQRPVARAFLNALRRTATFEAPDATDWVPREFRLTFIDAALHPELAKTGAWPASLARPNIRPQFPYAYALYESQAVPLIRELQGSRVTFDDTKWLVGSATAVTPEWDYIERVSAAADRAISNE